MRPPEFPAAAPSYAELFSEGTFAQRKLVHASDIGREARNRSLAITQFPRRQVLEPLDALGGFEPLGFRQTNYSVEVTEMRPPSDHLAWREEHNFQPWDQHAFELPHGEHPVVSECYSLWQLLYLPDALALSHIHAPPGNVFPDGASFSLPEDWAAVRRASVLTLDEAWRPTIKLLISLQSRFWPYRKNRITLFHHPETGELIDPMEQTIEEFEARALLDRFELSLDQLAQLHWAFLEHATRLDPTPHLQALLALSHRRKTDLLRGEALRARDFYDAAFMLRGLHHVATGDWLPTSTDESWVVTEADFRRRYLPREGVEPPQRTDLKRLLIGAGIYPHGLHIFYEGVTEHIVLQRLLDAMGLGREIQLTNLRGVDETARFEALFTAASNYSARTVLIADREGEIEKTLAAFQSKGLLTGKNDVLLWGSPEVPKSFEEANFSYGELLQAMRKVGRAHGGELTLRAPLLRAEFERRLEEASRQGKDRPALANTAIGLARRQEYGAVALTKGELAEALADILEARLRRSENLLEAGESQPLLRRLWVWLSELNKPSQVS